MTPRYMDRSMHSVILDLLADRFRATVVAFVALSLTGCGGGGAGGSGQVSAPPISSPQTYLVTTRISGARAGTVSPSSITVVEGSIATFSIAPQNGSVIARVTGCGGVLDGTTYTTAPIQAACLVSIEFAAETSGGTTDGAVWDASEWDETSWQ